MAINATCPNCNSKTTQSVAMLVQSGTTTRNTTGVAAGAARGRKGAAVYGSSSTTKSALVARYTPQPKPGYSMGALLLLIGLGSIPGAFAGGPVLLYGVGLAGLVGGLIVIRAVPSSQRAWLAKMEKWSALWVCKKCGHEWTPEAN